MAFKESRMSKEHQLEKELKLKYELNQYLEYFERKYAPPKSPKEPLSQALDKNETQDSL